MTDLPPPPDRIWRDREEDDRTFERLRLKADLVRGVLDECSLALEERLATEEYLIDLDETLHALASLDSLRGD